jgi:hypothetical protein
MNMEEPKKVGRPKYTTMEALVHRGKVPASWREDIIELGRLGKTQVHIVNYMGISWETYKRLQERDPKFLEVVNMAISLSEQWWIDIAANMWTNGQAKNINSQHWSLMMRNLFRERWSDRRDYDVKTDGKPITTDNNIIVEIVAPKKEEKD